MNAVHRASVERPSGTTHPRTVTIQFVFLAIFTVLVVTARWPGAYIPMMLALAGMLVGSDKIRFPAPFWWGMAIIAWAFTTSFFAMSPELARSTLIDRFKVMLIFLVVMNAIRTERQLWLYLLVVVGSFMIYPARGALLNYIHGDLLEGRTTWNHIYSNPNDLAAMSVLATGAALSIATAKAQKKVVRWSMAGCVAILIVVTLLTESRGGFIGLMIGLGPPLLVRAVKRPAIAIYALIAFSIGLTILPGSLWVRLSGMRDLTSTSTIREADKYGSAEQRWQIQQTAWKIFIDHPAMGVGLGCYPLANGQYAPDLGDRDTHDTYLNLAAELGAPGLLLWLTLVASVLLHVRRDRKADISTAEMIWLKYAMVGFLFAGIFGTYSGLTMCYLILGTLWAASKLAQDGGGEAAVARVS